MLTTLTRERLSQSVLAVPPLCRDADYSVNRSENHKLIKHIESGGTRLCSTHLGGCGARR